MDHSSSTVSWLTLNNTFDLLIKGLEPDVVCDIGAFDASDSIRMQHLVPNARLFAFEANPLNHSRYQSKAERAGVRYENLAITNYDGEISFNIISEENLSGEQSQVLAGQSSILTPISKIKLCEPVTVRCQQLDTYLLPKISEEAVIALWIDVEGAGYEVLLGGREVLKRTKLIKIETETWPYYEGQRLIGDTRSLLVEAGFTEIMNNDMQQCQTDLVWLKV